MPRPRALIVSRNLPPLQGGIERLMAHAVAALAADYDCHVIGPTGCAAHLPAGLRVRELPSFAPWFLFVASLQALLWRWRHGYAVAVAGNGLVAPVAALGCRRWFVFVHGLDLVAPHPLYQAGFVRVLRRAGAVVANSRHTRALAQGKGIAADRIHVVHPGVAPATPAPAGDFRARHGLGAGPMLLSVGRLVPRKGHGEFVEHALPALRRRFPDLQYVVVGAEATQAVATAAGVRAQILAAAQRVGAQAAVHLLGAIDDAELTAAYATADLLVFPSTGRGGDVEGFGMVLLEAAAHGLPAVAFDTGGVADAVSAASGLLVRDGDFAAFAAAVERVLSGAEPAITRDGCRRHAAANGWPQFAERVRNVARALEGAGER